MALQWTLNDQLFVVFSGNVKNIWTTKYIWDCDDHGPLRSEGTEGLLTIEYWQNDETGIEETGIYLWVGRGTSNHRRSHEWGTFGQEIRDIVKINDGDTTTEGLDLWTHPRRRLELVRVPIRFWFACWIRILDKNENTTRINTCRVRWSNEFGSYESKRGEVSCGGGWGLVFLWSVRGLKFRWRMKRFR